MASRLSAALLGAIGVAACGGGGGGDDVGDDDVGPGEQNSAAALREVAAAIYDAADTDGDVASYVEGVLLAFDVAVYAEPTAELDDRFAQGHPYLFEPQMHELADAYLDGGYVSVDSLLAAAAERGVTGPGGAPLDRLTFDAGFAALAGRPTYTRAEVLPAFVLALSAERTARYGGDDPLWGDGQLDPLQTVLLMYALSYGDPARTPSTPGARPAPAVFASEAVIEFVRDQLQGQVEGQVLGWVEIPTGADEDAATAILCSSLQLYGHKLKVTNAPDLIYHQQVDNAAPPAFTTTATAVLTFEDDWWDNRVPIDQWLFNELPGCMLQRRGPVPDKPLEWSESDGVADHGSFNFEQSMTDDNGRGVGYWSTVAETTPSAKRTFENQRDAVGSLIVRAGGLVPGWSTLERAVGFLRDTGHHGQDPLTIIYYVDPCASGLWGPNQCVDEWHGGAEGTYSVPEGGYKVTGTDLVWEPVVTGGGTTIYEITSGTISYELWDDTGCTYAFEPDTVSWDPAGTVASSIDYNFDPPPITYAGSGSMFWMAQMTVSCPDGSDTVPQLVGGQFFRADTTTQTGDVLADNYMLMGAYHYVYSFHR
jgi:hypothetical protein